MIDGWRIMSTMRYLQLLMPAFTLWFVLALGSSLRPNWSTQGMSGVVVYCGLMYAIIRAIFVSLRAIREILGK